MNNRLAFIDFVRGLLTINPLERWSPQQAKLHPFITQSKFTGPFVPPMNLKSSSLNRSPAPGTQQQQQAEAVSKQRAQQAQAQANTAAQNAYTMANAQYQSPSHAGSAYPTNNVYAPGASHVGNPPAYGAQPNPYGQSSMNQVAAQMPAANYGAVSQQQQQPQQQLQPQQPPPGVYQQAGRRPRATTMEQQQSGIPAAIQRVASHLDPNAPIRLQPSPAYYPPPADGGFVDQATGRAAGRRGSQQQGNRARSNRDFIRTLEERTLEEGYGQNNHWGH